MWRTKSSTPSAQDIHEVKRQSTGLLGGETDGSSSMLTRIRRAPAINASTEPHTFTPSSSSIIMSENEEILELGDDGTFDIPKPPPAPIASALLTPPPPPEDEEVEEEEDHTQMSEGDFEPGNYKMFKEEKSILVILRTASETKEVRSIIVEDGTKLIVAVGGDQVCYVAVLTIAYLSLRQHLSPLVLALSSKPTALTPAS
jgi:hypothetical protein